jgi:hypothetical protein
MSRKRRPYPTRKLAEPLSVAQEEGVFLGDGQLRDLQCFASPCTRRTPHLMRSFWMPDEPQNLPAVRLD